MSKIRTQKGTSVLNLGNMVQDFKNPKDELKKKTDAVENRNGEWKVNRMSRLAELT